MITAAPAWTVTLCRGTPGAEDVAEIAASRGAAVIWCGPECCGDMPGARWIQVEEDDPGSKLSPGEIADLQERYGEAQDD